MKVSDIMTKWVISISADGSILEAVRLMLQDNISGLPVVDAAGTLVGIVTEGDFLRRAETKTTRHRPRWLEFVTSPGKLADEYVHTHGRKVSEVMTPSPQTVTEETRLSEAVDLMERGRIKRLPVLREGKLVGMVTRANLLHALVSLVHEAKPSQAADWAIRDQILAELKRQPWAPFQAIDVTVRGGMAELWGTILDERERKALIVAVENTPGVKQVRDHLALIEPTSGILIYRPDDDGQRPVGP